MLKYFIFKFIFNVYVVLNFMHASRILTAAALSELHFLNLLNFI